MKKIYEYLKNCGTFYLATVKGDKPQVRPFGAVCEFEGKLYIVTNNQKDVYKQMKANPNVAICGMYKGNCFISWHLLTFLPISLHFLANIVIHGLFG